MKKSQKLTQYNEEALNYMLDVIKDHINKGKYQANERSEEEEHQQEQPLSKSVKKQREGIECLDRCARVDIRMNKVNADVVNKSSTCTKSGKVLNTASPAAIRIHQTSKYCNDNAKKVKEHQEMNKVRVTPKPPRLLSNK